MRMGVTVAVLRKMGTEPVTREVFMILEIGAERVSKHALRSGVGTGSREQVEVLDLAERSLMSDGSIGVKQ